MNKFGLKGRDVFLRRTFYGYSQVDFSNLLGISQPTCSRWENEWKERQLPEVLAVRLLAITEHSTKPQRRKAAPRRATRNPWAIIRRPISSLVVRTRTSIPAPPRRELPPSDEVVEGVILSKVVAIEKKEKPVSEENESEPLHSPAGGSRGHRPWRVLRFGLCLQLISNLATLLTLIMIMVTKGGWNVPKPHEPEPQPHVEDEHSKPEQDSPDVPTPPPVTPTDGGAPPAKGYPLPSKPFQGQNVAPCDFSIGEIDLNGMCWRLLANPPPCGRNAMEHEGKCYLPSPKLPTTKRPSAEGR